MPIGHTAYTWTGKSEVHTVASSDATPSVASVTEQKDVAPAPTSASTSEATPTEAPTKKAPTKVAPKQAAAPAAKPVVEAKEPSLDLLSELDFVVGKITQVKVHENADSLYVETIDVGTARGGERVIVSGLVKYIPITEMLGANVVIVANLKPAALRGVTSHGMFNRFLSLSFILIILMNPGTSFLLTYVLTYICLLVPNFQSLIPLPLLSIYTSLGMVLACRNSQDQVVLVTPPQGAQPGDRIVPLTDDIDWSNMTPAKEVNGRKEGSSWQVCAPHLKTNDNGEVTFLGNLFGVKGKGSATGSPNSQVS